MSAVNQLATEISTLITESRRRNNDIKSSSEYSLDKLKSFDPANSNEIQFLNDLSKDNDFITPLLLSFTSRNAKFSSISIQSLNKLIQYSSIPSSKIGKLLDALLEATYLAMDIQLKILQVLPTFYQIYGAFINGSLLSKFLKICSILQSPNKSPMVISTASATEQQIILSLFDKVSIEQSSEKTEKLCMVTLYDDQTEMVSGNSLDAFKVFQDYCCLINKEHPEFLPFDSTPEASALEIIENILNNNTALFQTHTELVYLLKIKLTPLLLRSFSSSNQFSITVRISRIILLLIKNYINTMDIEAEVILSLLNLTLTKDSNLQPWKKILALEIYSSLLQKFENMIQIFQSFDKDETRKDIIFEFLKNSLDIIFDSTTKPLLNQSEIVSPPDSVKAITPSNSSLRNHLMDQLDKQEPPQVPRSYIIFLILNTVITFCDGIGSHTMSLSNKHHFSFVGELESFPSEITDLQSLIKRNAKSLISLGSEFLYSSINSDLFHSLVRSLQKLCHSAGILGLDKERDSLLYMFSIATISNNQRDKPNTQRNASITESIAETINYATGNVNTKKKRVQPRDLNSRHVICFRALVSLAISLGPILGSSWRFVLVTFQWFSYYMNGSSKSVALSEGSTAPHLTTAEIKVIDSTILKLNENTRNLSESQYGDLLQSYINLASEAAHKKLESNDYFTEPISDNGIVICPFNTEFYIDRIGTLSEINISRFLKDDQTAGLSNWKMTLDYLKNICTSSDVFSELRLIGSEILNSIFKKMAEEGFSSGKNPDTEEQIELKLFNSLSDTINEMLSKKSKLDATRDNVDSKIIYDTLNTLNELLDRFGNSFQSSWASIIKIVGTPFLFYETSEQPEASDGTSKNILDSSFKTFQLIMNDFLHSVPVDDFKFVIDILEKFSTQNITINISFSAVSYYWLISDHFRGLILDAENTNDSSFLPELWLYLLNSLINICSDTRTEVKNGAIQTFFRIVDSHGDYLDWDTTFNTVIKTLLKTEWTPPKENNYELKRKFKENMLIILKGITDIFIRFIIHSKNDEYWEEYLSFCTRIISYEDVAITQTLYQSLYQILDACVDQKKADFDTVFNFWSSQQIKYVSNDSKSYQDMVIEYIRLFDKLNNHKLLSKEQLELSLSIFNNAIRFPFIPGNTPDYESCSKLQTLVLETLNSFEIEQEHSNMILTNLSFLILLPFKTRARIFKKLPNTNRDKVCTFICCSIKSIEILRSKLWTYSDLNSLVKEGTILKVFQNLIESIKSRPHDDADHSKRIEDAEIWKQSMTFLLELTDKLTNKSSVIEQSELWGPILDAFALTLPGKNLERDEEFNLRCYESFRDIVFSNICKISSNDGLINDLITHIWDASFLYEKNEVEKYLFESLKSPEEITKWIIQSNILDFSTEPLVLLPQKKFRLVSFNDFFMVTTRNFNYDDDHSKNFFIKIHPYLCCRAVMALKRFECSQRLLNISPVSSIQEKELKLTLENLVSLLRIAQNPHLKHDQPLLISKIVPSILRSQLRISQEFNEIIATIAVEFYN